MNKNITFIGAGNMAISLIKGLLASGYPAEKLTATSPSADNRLQVAQSLGIHCFEHNNDALEQAGIVVLAVKPQVLAQVCADIEASVIKHKPLIISVAAGVRSHDINRWLGNNCAVVRCMPNTPSMIQTGATGLVANEQVSAEQKSDAENILRSVGVAVWVDTDADIDSVTALSGSGPAYYFLFMEAMQQAAEKMGLSESTAKLLSIQTAFGAAKMALESSDSCQTLRQKVTSPNGTTEQAIKSFQANKLPDIVEQAMLAAKNRANQLADELSIANTHKPTNTIGKDL